MNRLKQETSPYLKMHAKQPVHWYAWGKEAFEAAATQNKPIFLSIGYSACHWCHVMSRECFENLTIASILNEKFVSIKVDREERPDIDSVYMNAIQLLTREGGWPLSAILTPTGEPFYGGTYFPPEPRYGLPSFPQILEWAQNTFHKNPQDVSHNIENLRKILKEIDSTQSEIEEEPSFQWILDAVGEVESDFDPVFGGFGDAPKFPHVAHLDLLLRHTFRTRESGAAKVLEKTLISMGRGGLFDQIGGGFHRYSTDRSLLVPHFEKMLYDNGLLLSTYSNAYRLFGREFYKETALRIGNFILSEMLSDEGGFYSTQHADSEGEEGKFYVYEEQDLESFLNASEKRLFQKLYGMEGPANFELQTYVPHHNHDYYEDLAEPESGLLPYVMRKELDSLRSKAYQFRKKRIAPDTDTKILLSWNAMAMDGLLHLFEITSDQKFLIAVQGCHELLESQMKADETRLYSVRAEGQSKQAGFLDDYTYYIRALIHLHRVTQEESKLHLAKKYQDFVNSQFYDSERGRFHFTSAEHEVLFHRESSLMDHSIPSGQGICLENLARLADLYDEETYREILSNILQKQAHILKKFSAGCTQALGALDTWLHGLFTITSSKSLELKTRLSFLQKFHPDLHLIESPSKRLGVAGLKPDSVIQEKENHSFLVCSKRVCSPQMRYEDALARLDY